MVWTIRDTTGVPAPLVDRGERRAMPFWSTSSRVERILVTVPAYADFKQFNISLADWRTRWLTGLELDRLLVGINWSGDRAVGYDLEPAEALARLQALEDLAKETPAPQRRTTSRSRQRPA